MDWSTPHFKFDCAFYVLLAAPSLFPQRIHLILFRYRHDMLRWIFDLNPKFRIVGLARHPVYQHFAVTPLSSQGVLLIWGENIPPHSYPPLGGSHLMGAIVTLPRKRGQFWHLTSPL